MNRPDPYDNARRLAAVRPGGTLILIALAVGNNNDRHPLWPLTRAEIEAFATTGLHPVRIETSPTRKHRQ